MPVLENAKHERFVQEYLKDLCQTAAYQRVYGAENFNAAAVSASKLIRTAKVAARVRELQEERGRKDELDERWVLDRLVKTFEKCSQEVEIERWDYTEKKMVKTGEFVFDSKGAVAALQLIGKHRGMFTDKLTVVDAGLADQLQQARARLAESKKERGGADGGSRTAGSDDGSAGREGTT